MHSNVSDVHVWLTFHPCTWPLSGVHVYVCTHARTHTHAHVHHKSVRIIYLLRSEVLTIYQGWFMYMHEAYIYIIYTCRDRKMSTYYYIIIIIYPVRSTKPNTYIYIIIIIIYSKTIVPL